MPDPTLESEYPGSYMIWPPPPDTMYGVPEVIQADCEWYEEIESTIDREREKTNMVFKALSLYAGSDKLYKVIVKDRCLNPINVYGGLGVMSLKVNKSDTAFVFQKHTNVPSEGVIGDPTQGELIFYITPADTTALLERQYVFDVRLTVSGKTYTVSEGTILIHRPVNP